MDNINEKILYLLRWLYDLNAENEKNILKVLDKMTEDEKMDLAYMLYKKLNVKEQLIKEALLKLKVVDHNIEEYTTKKEADIWLEKILSKI